VKTLFCGRKLNKWELGKISYMQEVRTRHNGYLCRSVLCLFMCKCHFWRKV